MAASVWELQSFLGKFIQLTNEGILANLTLTNTGENIVVNLQSTLKNFEPLPTIMPASPPTSPSACTKPSRVKRRKRRHNARINNAAGHSLKVDDVGVRASPDDVLPNNTDNENSNCDNILLVSDVESSTLDDLGIEFGDRISTIMENLAESSVTDEVLLTHSVYHTKENDLEESVQIDEILDKKGLLTP